MTGKKITNDINSDYRLVGIAGPLKEYRFCFYLNNLLSCDFRKLKDLAFEPRDRTRTIHFSVFHAEGEEEKNQFAVFANKNNGDVLLPEAAAFDFVMTITGKFDDTQVAALIEGIKEFPGVVMSAEIPLKKVKNKERLVYEEERPVTRLMPVKRF